RLIEMTGMVEKPPVADAPSNLKITGRYILQPEVFGLLESQGKGAGGEIQLTDAMARLMEVQSFYAYEYEGQDYDCGSKLGYFEAVLGYALANEEIGEDAKALAKAMLDKL
ncbi:MAG TPA: UTP--glucose-1-phosphate uridylyltransferase, partial [Hyphomonas sp.]|nr:UTP--glucose-1-phosphate uridylyltransferase [Hyphomonas sp.]